MEYVVLMTQIASGDEVNKRCRSAVEALEAANIKIGETVEIEISDLCELLFWIAIPRRKWYSFYKSKNIRKGVCSDA